MRTEGTGLNSPVRHVREANEEALVCMNSWQESARRDVAVGEVGRDYFYGECTVTAVFPDSVELRDSAGASHTLVKKYWFGLR